MNKWIFLPLAGLLVALTACGSNSANKSNGASAPAASQTAPQQVAATVVATSTPSAAAATGTATSAPSSSGARASTPSASVAFATPATNPLARVSGTVQSVNSGTVMLADGTSFTVSPQTSVTVVHTVTASALQVGQTVAVTAKRQADNTLLASLVRIFPSGAFGAANLRQFPLDAGNLMTNATIDKVQGSSFSVTFTGGADQVTLAPDAVLQQTVPGTLADIKAGVTVSAGVANGAAANVSVQ